MDDLLHRHRVDVCRSLALLGFAGAINDTLQMILQPIFAGTWSVNFGPLITVWVSCALWMRRPWTRTLLMWFGWSMAVLFGCFAIKAVVYGDLALTFYGLKVAKPTTVQYVAFTMVIVPAVYLFLRVVHSRKFIDEVSGREDQPESIPTATPTPPALGSPM